MNAKASGGGRPSEGDAPPAGEATGEAVAPHLAAMGQLAAGVAHEINTPAQYVSDNIHFLKDAFDGVMTVMASYRELHRAVKSGSVRRQTLVDLETALREEEIDYLAEQVPEAIEQSLEGMRRISGIVEAMRDFSHPGLMEKRVVDINRAIHSTVTVSRNVWKYAADLETDFQEPLDGVPCEPGEINRVFLNLIGNAADAVREALGDGFGTRRGKIRISTRQSGRWVEVRVEDTGTGIPASIRDRIFDSFFTTKPQGKGTGQGLAICATIVANHGGTISCESEPGRGAAFIVRLPAEQESEQGP